MRQEHAAQEKERAEQEMREARDRAELSLREVNHPLRTACSSSALSYGYKPPR
jgi:hypothetical protein